VNKVVRCVLVYAPDWLLSTTVWLPLSTLFSSRIPRVITEVAKATAFAARVHSGQVRPGGQTQFEHVTEVGETASRFADRFQQDNIPAELLLSDQDAIDLIVSALLHDVLEDTDTTDEELAEQFGERVARIVRAVSHEEEEEPDEAYLHRVADGGLLALLVKLSDRLRNLDGLRGMERSFRERKLKEIRASLSIWYDIFPEGAVLIEELLEEVEHESTTL